MFILHLTENNCISLVVDVEALFTHTVLHLVTHDCNIMYSCTAAQ